ncbi:MAG: hypothetical protein KIS92_07670, partial [Planctomycetota bacterium]|nr:hypothetical protein [Planctomycetota bacterium]
FEVGAVGMKVTLGKDGKLIEAVESRREGDVSDASVGECRRALEQAAPHDPFPSELGGKETITLTIGFIY